MTTAQGWWIVVDLTILVGMSACMMLAVVLILLRVAKKISDTTDSIPHQITTVTERATAVVDQAQKTVGLVATKVEVMEKVVGGVVGAVSGATAVRTASRVAHNSSAVAGAVLTSVRAGLDRLLHSHDDQAKGDK